MSTHRDTAQRESQGRHLGMPYDLRRPTATRFRARAWNPDPRLLTPKAFGWGFTALLCAATIGMLAPAAPAWAAPATTLQVNPGAITAGDTVVISGSVGPAPAGSACATSVMLLSRAFAHTEEFAGVPAVMATVKPGGTFAATTRIPGPPQAGRWIIPLVAMAIVILGALAVLLLYRRRTRPAPAGRDEPVRSRASRRGGR
jgi:hypothetical protein